MSIKMTQRAAIAAALLAASAAAPAVEWSDTSLGYRYGTRFAEPYGRTDISKNIFSLTHASGYKYGTNFFNVDFLQSDSKDPAAGVNSAGAQEAYMVYRHTLDFGKISGKDMKSGFVRGWGATVGFDWNTKNDAYSSKKRMLVLGPTMMLDVPGFLNVSLLALAESNAPTGVPRYTYKTHGALDVSWGIPIGSMPLSFGGYFLYIGSKGTNEFGGPTAAETHLDAKLMLDLGALASGPKNTFLMGFAYEYWKNKFGNPTTGAIGPGSAGPGATAKTPMIRAEYHF